MRRFILGIGILSTIAATGYGAMNQDDIPRTGKFSSVKEYMKPKLGHAQRILEGLATENFTTISESATVLMTLSDAASWQVLPGIEYTQNTTDFQRAVSKLQEAARKKNLDGATLAYMNMTMSCVNCHKAIRHPEPQVKPSKAKAKS